MGAITGMLVSAGLKLHQEWGNKADKSGAVVGANTESVMFGSGDLPPVGSAGSGGTTTPAPGAPAGATTSAPAAADAASQQGAAAGAVVGGNNPAPATKAAGETSSGWNLRNFDDHTYILIHLLNLVNLRNETPKLNEKGRVEADSEGAIDLTTSLKGALPFAYYPTKANPGATNATIQCYGEPYSFVNFLTAHPNYHQYVNEITTDKLSSLSPKIRLYKVFHDDASNQEQIIEFKFDKEGISGAEVQELLNNGSKRGYGAGIKDFNITLDGTNPYTRTRSISATLVLHANSIEAYLKPRSQTVLVDDGAGGKNPKKFNYRYFDLSMITDTTPTNHNTMDTDGTFGTLEDMDYKIMAEVGIVPNNFAGNAINDAYSSMNLSLQRVNHTYNIQQDGSVDLTIEYKGFIEKEFAKPTSYDAFATVSSTTTDIYKQMGSQILQYACSAKDASNFEKKLIGKTNDFNLRVSSLTDRLRTRGKLYFIKISPETMQAYNQAFNDHKGATKSSDKIDDNDHKEAAQRAAFAALKKALSEAYTGEEDTKEGMTTNMATSRDEKELERAMAGNSDHSGVSGAGSVTKCAIDPNATQVVYFYAGDLINIILDELSEIYSREKMSSMIENAKESVMKTKAFQDISKDIPLKVSPAKIQKTFMSRASRFEKLRVVLGPTQFKDFFSEETIMCSIGDIPVPLNHFSSWLAKEVMGRGKTRIGLSDFLNSFIGTYMRIMLKGTTAMDQELLGYRKTFNSTPIVGHASKQVQELGTDKLSLLRLEYGGKMNGRRGLIYETVPVDHRPLIDTSNTSIFATSKKGSYDYLVFYDSHAKPVKDRNGNFALDIRSGIYRYEHGKSRGILKNVEYTATNIQGRKEARFQQGKFSGLQQLTEVFNVTVTTFADFQKYPGQRFYLEASSLVPYLSKETLESLNGYSLADFGIGGYYLIDQVQHNISQNKFETIIRAQWEQFQRNRPNKEKEEKSVAEIEGELAEAEKNANVCKNALDGPQSAGGGSGSLWDMLVDAARTIGGFFGAEETFGGYAERGIGYIKGLFDVSDADPEDSAGIEAALGQEFSDYWAAGGESQHLTWTRPGAEDAPCEVYEYNGPPAP